MRSSNPIRAASALGAVALLGLLGALDYREYSRNRNETQPDPYRIEQQVAQLQAVRQIVPADARVGYISDLPMSGVAGQAIYAGTAYALAPRLVVDASAARPGDYVLAAFSKPPSELAGFARQNGLVFERDLSGIILFRKVR